MKGKRSIVNKKICSSLIALALLLSAAAVQADAAQNARRGKGASQGRRETSSTSTPARNGLLSSLPASDAILQVDAQRLMREVLPRVLDQNKLAQANAEMEKFKTETGLDPRSFENIAVGMRFVQLEGGATKVNTVALARGSFNAGALVAAGRLASKGKYTEEKYNGATIYTFDLNEQVKLFGLLSMRVSRLGVSALNDQTLALGEPAMVRAAIDAGRAGGARAGAELVQLATRAPKAILAFGANLPRFILSSLNVPNDEIARNLSGVRQVYGSVGASAAGFDSLLVARTENAEQAKSLSDTIYALKQFGPLVASRLSGAKAKLAQNALDSLKVTSQGNELQLRLAVAQTDLNSLIGGM